VSDVRGVICRRNFHEVETDGGLFEGQVNGLEESSSEGFVERMFELEADVFIRENREVVGNRNKIELSMGKGGGGNL